MNQDQLEARLAQLESDNRRLRRIGGIAALGLGALSLMSFAAPALCDTVWAERFVLRDASNKARMTMNAYATDTPSLVFHDARGKKMGSFGIAPDGSFRLEVMKDGKFVPATFQAAENGGFKLADAASVVRGGVVQHLEKGGVN
ncbi:MAG: hypothetical protein AAGG01_19520 [Planctomycetota bacterium]